MTYKKFIFQKYELATDKTGAKFYYSLDDKINFVETIKFDRRKINWGKVNSGVLSQILFNLHLVLGISYYKTYCPKQIIVNSGVLNKKQAQFWDKLYIKGLGEFFYKNKINFKNLIVFPYKNIKVKAVTIKLNNRSLAPVGGGKDSVVTAELLKKGKFNFSLISLRDSVIQREVSKIINKDRIIIGREIDKNLTILNQKCYYNGHVPITAINSFASLLACVLYDYKNIVFSNERSANYGNVKYLGQMINHQYSKTFEFEKDFNNYVHKFITPSINYFSLLRPISELKIVEMFTKYKKYFSVFSSCNQNFAINQKTTQRWCGECAKCAFMFNQLAAFIKKEELIKFFGKNMYADKSLQNLYLELMGEKNIKPFDCVGTPEEVKVAFYLAYSRGEYKDDIMMKYFSVKILPKIKNINKLTEKVLKTCGQHNVPKEFNKIVKTICQK
jgi:UDP-N-acetyl-alpha-D-muramoyl-L-alanyl-L-glutamate epimerase